MEKNLPGTLLTELGALNSILADMAQVALAAELAADVSTPDHFQRLRAKTDTVYNGIVEFRDSFVFDNLVQASAFHSVVAPAVADLQIWLSEGVSGFSPESETTAHIILSRITEAYQTAYDLRQASQVIAQNKLKAQREQLDRFLASVNLLLVFTVAITFTVVFLLARQYGLQRKRDEAQARRELAEQSLRESEARFRRLTENAQDMIYRQSLPDGRYEYVSPAALELIGYTPDEIINEPMHIRKAVHPDWRDYLETNWKQMKAGQIAPYYEYKIIDKAGNEKWLYQQNVLIRDAFGKVVATEGIVTDVTARKRFEQSLKESEKRYRSILESIEDGYYEVDLAGNFVFFNDAMSRILRYSQEELMGMNNQAYMDERSLKKVFRTFNHVYRTGLAAKTTDWELIRKDGKRRFIETSISLITDSDGRPTGFRGLCRDVSDKRSLEAQLQRSQKMEALGLLAGGVAHDLNNVLSGIVSYPELLLMDLPDGSPLKRPLETIQQSGKRASEIVQDLLTLARRGVTQTTVVNLNTILEEYLSSPEHARLLSHHRSVRLESSLAEELLNIRGSAIHLKKTIMNLVANAAEAQPRGGLISITTENRYVDQPLAGYEHVKEGDYAVLQVADTGAGITPEDLKHLFEPFYTRKVMGRSGTGLGMAVVWGTMQDHKGYIDIKSTPDEGTLFELYFPATRDGVRREASALPVADYSGAGEVILVVDDIQEQRDIASGILQRLGYAVVTAASGEEAVTYLKTHTVDLVVLDMIMDPGMDGLDTYKQMLLVQPGQKAVVSSGFSETERVREVQRLGARLYIKKPYTVEKIGVAVKSALEQR
jgi:PAS domain S-box-containing protein